MRNFLLVLMFVIVCVGLSLGCAIAGDHLYSSVDISEPYRHYLTWNWLRIAAMVFGGLPVAALIAFVCCFCAPTEHP